MSDFILDGNKLIKYTGKDEYIQIPYGVEVIADGAFANCKTVVSITFPDTIRIIEELAFYCCDVKNVEFNNGLRIIDECAFYSSHLESVKIPDTVYKIGPQAFLKCNQLEEVILPKNLASITIGLFEECVKLNNIEFPGTLETIDNYAFSNCTSLTSIDIPATVTFIGDQAFYGCTNLSKVYLEEGLKSIGAYAFCGCVFPSIEIPTTVTDFGNNALLNCTELVDVYCDESISDLVTPKPFKIHTIYSKTPSELTSHFKIENGLLSEYTGNDEVIIIPDGVLAIKENVFKNCNAKEIIVPSSVKRLGFGVFESSTVECVTINCKELYNIPYCAFKDCTSLRIVHISEGIESIDSMAFYGCTALKEIHLPSTLTHIGEEAFSECKNLIKINLDNIYAIKYKAFYNCLSINSDCVKNTDCIISPDAFMN